MRTKHSHHHQEKRERERKKEITTRKHPLLTRTSSIARWKISMDNDR